LIITWLTVAEYLCHKWPQICSVCRNHNPVFFSFRSANWVCSKITTSGAGTSNRNN